MSNFSNTDIAVIAKLLAGAQARPRMVQNPDLRKLAADLQAIADLDSRNDHFEEWSQGRLDAQEIERAIIELAPLAEAASESPRNQTSEIQKVDLDGLKLTEKANRILEIVNEQEEPFLFKRNGKLVQIRPVTVCKGETETLVVRSHDTNTLTADLDKVMDFSRTELRDGNARTVRSDPPAKVINNLLAMPDWQLPLLTGISRTPMMRKDGTSITTPGYDEETGIYFAPEPGFKLEDVQETQEAAFKAAERLKELLTDFPFEDEASRTNAIAAMVAMVARPMIEGQTPAALLEAPTQGSGKTKLGGIIVMAATGEYASMGTAPDDDPEWNKRITSQLLAGRVYAYFDNLTGNQDPPALAAAITSPYHEDRLLGRNETVRLSTRVSWFLTGNNCRLGPDMAQRVYLIRLDPHMARPGERTDFAHPDIEKYVMEHRGEIVAALLTMCRAWVVAGRPAPTCRQIRFKEFRYVVGGILEYAGLTDFLGNQSDVYELSDDDTPAWEAFIAALAREFPSQEVTAKEIEQRLVSKEHLKEYLPNKELRDSVGTHSFAQSLGYALRDRRNKMHGDSCAKVEIVRSQNPRTWRFSMKRRASDESNRL